MTCYRGGMECYAMMVLQGPTGLTGHQEDIMCVVVLPSLPLFDCYDGVMMVVLQCYKAGASRGHPVCGGKNLCVM
jgi:hypothetical protein